MTKKASAQTKAKDSPVQQPDVPEWIAQMHQHYQSHGYYRGADVMRVLGDPTASVKGDASEEAFAQPAQTKRSLVNS